MLKMSNVSEEGVSQVKNEACEKLLAARVDSRVSGNKVESVMNRLQVVYPTARDGVTRDAFIPESVKREREVGAKNVKKSRKGYAPTVDDSDDEADDTPPESDDEMVGDDGAGTRQKTARELMWENGGPGVWAPDYREQYDLKDPEWRFDAIPEILDGKNIMDYVDPEIDAKLNALEKEEEQLAAESEAAAMGDDESDLDEEEEAAVEAIRERKKEFRMMSFVNKSENKPMMPRAIRGRAKDKHDRGALDSEEIRKKMNVYGVDTETMIESGRKRGRSHNRRRSREISDDEMEDMDTDGMTKKQKKKQKKEKSDEKSVGASKKAAKELAKSPAPDDEDTEKEDDKIEINFSDSEWAEWGDGSQLETVSSDEESDEEEYMTIQLQDVVQSIGYYRMDYILKLYCHVLFFVTFFVRTNRFKL
jgi:nucleolar GTP-binding protein